MTHITRHIGILLFDGITALDVVGPMEVFSSVPAHDKVDHPPYTQTTIGLTGLRCRSEAGLVLEASCLAKDMPSLDTLIVPGGSGLRVSEVNKKAADLVSRHAPAIRRIASVCTGIYGLAPTGLLDGRRVTTHWRFAEPLKAAFPQLVLEQNQIYVRDGKYYTSGGVSAGIDLALALVEEDYGRQAALDSARELVVYMRRAGGQDQFSEPLRFQQAARDSLADVVQYILSHLQADLSVSVLAQQVCLSERQFSRKCQQVFAMTPAALVSEIRLDAARQHLLQANTPLASVAASVGYKGTDAFSRAFTRRFGVSPSDYRQRFANT